MIKDTTIFRPLQRLRFIKIEEWQLILCEQNQPAAALLAFLCSYHNGRQDDKVRANEINQFLEKRGKTPSWNETDWQFHTDKMLIRGVLLFKMDAIRSGIEYLKKRELIWTDPPPNLKEIFKTGRTKWFCINYEAINQWIATSYGGLSYAADKPPIKPFETVDSPPSNTNAKRLFTFWQSTMKRERSVMDDKRLKVITARLKQFSTSELALAIIGNSLSAYHQGDNKDRRKYNDLTLIFRDAEKVEYFMQIAENEGINASEALQRLESIESTDSSDKTRPDAPETPNSTTTAVANGHHLTEAEMVKHRVAAGALAPFVAANVALSVAMDKFVGGLSPSDAFEIGVFRQLLTSSAAWHVGVLTAAQQDLINRIILEIEKMQSSQKPK